MGRRYATPFIPATFEIISRSWPSRRTFLVATSRSIRPKRMADRECVLRFLAFHMDWESYSVNDLDGFLSDAMEKVNEMSKEERRTLEKDF